MAAANPVAILHLQQNHRKLWTRSQYSTLPNNLAESFNNWIKADKGLYLDDLIDTIRQKLLIKWNQRKKMHIEWKEIFCHTS